MKTIIAIYIMGYIISYFLIAGWMHANDKSRWPDQTLHDRKEDLGFVLIWSGVASVAWPIFLPGTFAITGFAQDGWSLRP